MSDLDIGTLVAHLKVDDAGMDFKGALEKIRGFGGEGGKAAKVAGVAIAAGLATAVASAMNVEPARKKLAAQLRLTPAEQATINASADKLFSGNYAENIGEANDVLRSVIGNFKDMRSASTEDLTAVGVMASNTASLMGEEFDKITKVAGQLVKDGLAKNATEAFDLITAASQNTSADMQGDLLDVAGEYSKHFATLGISGSEAMKLISDASANGAIGMDKVGDALKELTIRATDMSTTSVASYQAAGLNAQDMAAKILAGGDTAHAGFEQIVDGLLSIQDPTARANAAIGLFGTPLEDLGTDKIPAFLTSLKNAGDGLGDVAGRADEAGKMLNDSTQASFQSMVKTIQAKAIELGDAIIPFIKPFVDAAGQIIGWVSDIGSAFGSLPGPVKVGVLALGGVLLVAPKVAAAIRTLKQEMAFASYGMGTFAGGWAKIGKMAAGAGALVGVSVLIGSISDAFAQIKQRQQEVTQTTQTLTDSLVANGGAWSESIRQQQVSMIANTDAFKALIAAGADYNTAMNFMTTGSKEYGDALFANKQVIENLDPRMLTQVLRLGETSTAAEDAAKKQVAYNETQKQTGESADAAGQKLTSFGASVPSDALKALHEQGISSADALATLSQMDADTRMAMLNDETNAAWKAMETAAAKVVELGSRLTPMAQAAQDAADAQTELDDATKRVLAGLDKLAGRVPTVEQANSDLAQATADMADKFKIGEKDATHLSDAILNQDGTIKTATQAGRDFRDQTLQVREAMVTAAQAAYADAVAHGDQAHAQQKAKDAADAGYQAYLANAQAMGISEGKAKDAAAAYNAVPDVVASTIKADNSQAIAAANAVAVKLAILAATTVSATANIVTNFFTNRTETVTTRYSTVGSPNRPNFLGGLAGFAGGGSPAFTGLVPGTPPVNPRQDNLLAALETGELISVRSKEFIVNEKDTKDNLGLLQLINSGRVKAFAGGGMPSAGNLAGWKDPTYSGRQGVTLDALADLSGWIKDINQASRDAAQAMREEANSYRDVRAAQAKVKADGALQVRQAQADQAKVAAEGQKARTQARLDWNADVAKAKASLAAAKTTDQRITRERKLAEVQAAGAKAYNAALAAERAANAQAAKKTAQAKAEAAADNKAAAAKTAAAKAAYNADVRAAAAAKARAVEANKDAARTATARNMLVALSRQADQVTANLASAKDKLAGLQSDRASLVSSIAGNVSGSVAGITGYQDQRRTAADIIRGLTADKNQIAGFTGNLSRIKALGLDPALLQDIASGGVNNAVTASALAGATKAQIAQINSIVAQTNKLSASAGNVVAGATFDKAIAAQTAAVKSLDAKLDRLTNIDEKIAKAVASQFKTLTNQGLAVLVAKGNAELARR